MSLGIATVARVLLPKRDAPLHECEDAIAIDIDSLCCAVADGATEGFDSRRWARYLTRAWVSRSTEVEGLDLGGCVRPLGERLERRWAGRALPWYLEEKAASGAFAAFVGVRFTRSWTWSAVAIGDACMVVERDGRIHQSFPLSSASEFSSRPILVPSRPVGRMDGVIQLAHGLCEPGDVILLMSDAICAWYFAHAVSEGDLHGAFHRAMSAEGEMARFVAVERGAGRLRNDDVAIVRLAIAENVD